MGKKEKWIENYGHAASRLLQDIGQDNVKSYSVTDFQQKVQLSCFPEKALAEVSQVDVVTSGNPDGLQWIGIVLKRVDEKPKSTEKVLDRDSALFVLQSNSGDEHPSGVITYHQKHPERTTDLPGYEFDTIDQTVIDLRQTLTTGIVPLEQAPSDVRSALSHLHDKFGADFSQYFDQDNSD